MKKIKIYFSDFWGSFYYDNNYFYNLLKLKYDIILDGNEPDILFYSVFGNNHHRFDRNKTIKIFYTGENIRPNFNDCDYSFSFDYLDDNRNYRLPLWVLYINWFNRPIYENNCYLVELETLLNKNKNIIIKNKFCSFLASNPSGKRVEFVPKLSNYKRVDCGGKLYNNIPQISGTENSIEKFNFIENYKFNISFENSSYPGYCTEKIIHSMDKKCIPIYWGDEFVSKDFNKNSFLDFNSSKTDEKLIDEIIKIDNNDKLYQEILDEPWFVNNKIPDYLTIDTILNFLEKIINR